MKKRTLILTTAFLMIVSISFANRPVPEQIVSTFSAGFKNVSNVKWEETNQFYKASFMLNQQSVNAYYSLEGELMAVSRKIQIEQLPLALLVKAKENEMDKNLNELFEISSENGTEYYISVTEGKKSKTYKSSDGGWMRY